jgi:opacity protein-like surface antigen
MNQCRFGLAGVFARTGIRTTVSLVALGCSLLSMREAAAQPPAQERGLEATIFTGFNRDLSLAQLTVDGLTSLGFRDARIESESTGEWMLGVNVAGEPSRFLLVFAEFLYADFGEFGVSARPGNLPPVSVAIEARTFEWTGGVRGQFPTGSSRVHPYVGGGVGLVRLEAESAGSAGSVGFDQLDYTYHIDVGTRIFLTNVFGIAPEFRVVKFPDARFYRFVLGAVFRAD